MSTFSPVQIIPTANVTNTASICTVYTGLSSANTLVQFGPLNAIPVGTGPGTRTGSYHIVGVRISGDCASQISSSCPTGCDGVVSPLCSLRLIVNHSPVQGSITDCSPAIDVVSGDVIHAPPTGFGSLKIYREWQFPLVTLSTRTDSASNNSITVAQGQFYSEYDFRRESQSIPCGSVGTGANDSTRHLYLLFCAKTPTRYHWNFRVAYQPDDDG